MGVPNLNCRKPISINEMTRSSPKKYRVHSLERGLDLIDLLAKAPVEKSLKDLSL